MQDTGGAAEDIYNYVMGPEFDWDADDEERKRFLPVVGRGSATSGGGLLGGGMDDDERNEEYVAAAKQYLPEILALGALTGKNDKKQLAFFKILQDDAESDTLLSSHVDLSRAIQHALLNDCANATEEAMRVWPALERADHIHTCALLMRSLPLPGWHLQGRGAVLPRALLKLLT